MKKSILLSFLLFLFLKTYGQWTNDTLQNTRVRDTLGATVPLITSAFNGSSYISWFEYGPTGVFELHMQLLDIDGYKQWGPDGIIVSSMPQNSAIYRYDLKTDLDGNAIVAFQDERLGPLLIVVYKIDLNGNSLWGNGVSLVDSSAAEELSPVIGITGHNDVVVAWTSDSASSKWISCQRLDASGTPQWTNIYTVRNASASIKYSRPKLLPFLSAGIQMLYVEETGGFPGVSTLFAQHIDASGNNLMPNPIQVSTKTIPFFFFPEPVYDNTNGFFVAFNSSNPVNFALNDVYVQHVDSAGNLWSAAGTEAHNSTSEQKLTGSTCFVPSMNEFWVLLRVLDGGQTISGVSLQKFDSAGNVLLSDTGKVILNPDAVLYDPYTINDASDGIIFSSYYSLSSFGNEHILAMKTDYYGNTLWSGQPVSLCAVASNKDDIASGKFYNNNLVFVWQDDRNGSGIFAQNITGNGTTGITTSISAILQKNFSFYPNPSASPVLILSPGEHTIVLSDITGKKILSEKTSALSYSFSEVSSLPEGIYFLTVEDGTAKSSVKWCKIN